MKICKIDGCAGKSCGLGLCMKHYTRFRNHGDPHFTKRPAPDKNPPSFCKIEGCNKKTYSFGLCPAHYTRKRRHGSPTEGRTPPGEPLAYLKSLVGTKIVRCINWPYAKSSDGYALVTVDGTQKQAANFMCRISKGPPPTDKHECAHNCGRGHEACVNPNHLRWATRKENHADKHIHGTHNKGERNWNSKLTENEARYIKENPSNLTGASLAELFGVSRSAVSAIQVGKRWSWL